uniref:UDP-glucuronosyltransferase n=1 Tax=Clastoptera arizonana TaxID=38151 RepID=A0A1B6E1B5_9HEMI
MMINLLFELFTYLDNLVLEQLLQKLNNHKFDLVMTEIFNTDLFLGFAYKYKANIISLSSCPVVPWGTQRFGIPDNPAYIPYAFSSKIDLTSFTNRLWNFYSNFILKTVYEQYYLNKISNTAKKYFGSDMTSLEELTKKTSLLLVNSHPSLKEARPLPPQVIEIGGLHVKPAKPLPKDIEDFINASEHGVVLFSFGSIVQSSTMSESTRRAFCDVFSQLPQRVLWKWEEDEMPEKPENVKIVKWLPQRDVLGHPNIKLFISHGGLLGTIEAVHNAVPILGIPFFGDQMQNIAYLAQIGVAIQLDFVNITKESVSYAVKTLLNDKSFKERAVKVSEIYHDRPQSPLDTAVYWTEYVIRHKGAHHLRTAAVDLPWYQYLLLDVIFVLLLCCITVVVIIFYVVKLIYKTLCETKQKQKIH